MAPTCVTQATEDTNANGHRGPVQPSLRERWRDGQTSGAPPMIRVMADIAEQKRTLRVAAKEMRRAAHEADPQGRAALAVRDRVMNAVPLPANGVVGAYWPIGSELDVRPLLAALHARGHICALPVTIRGQPLEYHPWTPDTQLVAGVFGIPMPAHGGAALVPDMLIVPLLAFDARGVRLGYGGGYKIGRAHV